MTIEELTKSGKFLERDSLEPYREAVRKQATTHVTRRLPGDSITLIDELRPNEGTQIQDYRSRNERQITRSGANKFIAKASRVITSGLTFQGIEGDLKVFIESKPFKYGGSRYGFDDYIYQVVFREGIRHPNRILCAFPYTPGRRDIAPAEFPSNGGLAEEETLGIDILMVEYAFADDDLFAFKGGTRKTKFEGVDREADFFYVATDEMWYTLEPRWRKVKGRVELYYIFKTWYKWELGRSPVNMLPGDPTWINNGNTKGFILESYLLPYFTLADEVITAFSDNQGVRVRFNHPFVEMEPLDCQNPSCSFGDIIKDGKKVPCPDCKGTGKVRPGGVFGTYTRERKGTLDDSPEKERPMVQFYTPPVGIMDSSYNTWKDLYRLAKQEIGLDLLDGTGVESGHAKDLRLEDLRDLLTRISMGLAVCGVNLLGQIDALLNVQVKKRNELGYRIPATMKLLDSEQLMLQAKEALPEDRFQSRLNYYKTKYTGQPELIAMYELALLYAPALLLEEKEIEDRLAIGTLQPRDIVKRDYAIMAIKALLADGTFSLDEKKKVSYAKAFGMIDQYLEALKLFPARTVPLFDNAAKEEPKEEDQDN